jgi:hypothetical protein
MSRPIGALVASTASLLLLGSTAPSGAHPPVPVAPVAATEAAAPMKVAPMPAPSLPAPPQAKPELPLPPTPREALENGVLMVVSLPSQRMFVFAEGEVWDSSPVSTGRPGYDTPAGVFPILQKRVHHRSNLYDDAPMPYMQRLTWDGVALHAGHVPGHPASHGCIRLPTSFARKLYDLTTFASTVVLVSDQPLGSADDARKLVTGEVREADTLQVAGGSSPAPGALQEGPIQTIQLAASASPQNAARLWEQLHQRRPELRGLDHAIIPATVRSQNVFRLRASGRGAHSICSGLTKAGVACLRITS